MKKLSILILLTSITLTSCDQIAAFFATLTANRTEGTTEDEFTFTVDTNDTVIGWYIDGRSINRSERSISSESFTFSPGNHTVTVETENVDPVSVNVYVYEPAVDPEPEPVTPLFFNIALKPWAGISDLSYDSPVLRYELYYFNLYEITNNSPYWQVYPEDTPGGRFITLTIGAYDWLISEMSSTASQGLSETEFIAYLDKLYNTTEPVPVITETVFSVFAVTSNTPDTFSVSDTNVTISGVSTDFSDLPATISGTTQTLHISFKVDTSDATIFYGDNLKNFFGMDYTALTLDELKTVAEILRRFPEENMIVLGEELGK